MNRLVEFKVDHPNLYASPVVRKMGKKSFDVNKNKNSEDFRLTTLTPISLRVRPIVKSIEKDPYAVLRERLIEKDKEIDLLKKITQNCTHLNENRRKYMSPEPRIVMQERHYKSPPKNGSFSLMHQVYYSKSRPKVIQNNPILGYPTLNLSPEKRLANLGNLILNSSIK